MEVSEATKLFFALSQKQGALDIADSRGKVKTEVLQFLTYMGQYFSEHFERFDDNSMAFVLSTIANSPPKTT